MKLPWGKKDRARKAAARRQTNEPEGHALMPMNDMLKKYLGSLIRGLLAGVIPWLAAVGMSESEGNQFVTMLAGLIVAVLWSWWEKRQARKETLAGLALPAGSTLADVKATVSSGAAPDVTTAVHEVPVLNPATAAGD